MATRGSLSKCAIRLRDFFKATKAVEFSRNEETVSALKLSANHLAREIRLHELDMKKMALGVQAAEAELLYYDDIEEDTQKTISAIRDEIESLRSSLVNETKIRKNREEYEALAKMASERPSSRKTKRKIEEIEAEMGDIHKDIAQVQKKLDVKEKQFLLLVRSVADLKNGLGEDEEREKVELDIQNS